MHMFWLQMFPKSAAYTVRKSLFIIVRVYAVRWTYVKSDFSPIQFNYIVFKRSCKHYPISKRPQFCLLWMNNLFVSFFIVNSTTGISNHTHTWVPPVLAKTFNGCVCIFFQFSLDDQVNIYSELLEFLKSHFKLKFFSFLVYVASSYVQELVNTSIPYEITSKFDRKQISVSQIRIWCVKIVQWWKGSVQ